MLISYLLILLQFYNINSQEHEIPKFKRGPIEIVEETALTNPNSFDYDFSEDLTKPVDNQDLYDQFIDQLPHFHIFKLGKDRGVTEVPIVTRGWGTWFTPSTLSNREEKFTFFATTPMTPKKKINEEPKTTTTRKPTTTTTREPTTVSTTIATTTSATTQKPTTTTTTTTTQRPTPRATQRPTTTTTTTTTTTQRPTTTTTTTQRPAVTRNRFRVIGFKQPRPAFRDKENPTTTTTTTTQAPFNRGPVWRKTGVVFEATTTQRAPTPRTWTRRVFGQRVTTTEATTTVATTTPIPRRATTMGTRWVVGPRQPQRINQNWRQPIRQLQQSLERRIPPTHTDPLSRAIPKPVVIQNPKNRYSGPTYNCGVLNPFTDGTASDEHDSTCKMLYPGLSIDGSCRCFYKVASRDSRGCATGFIYACRQLHLHSVSV